MFDIGFTELLLLSIVALLVLGPERLPGAVRTGSFWLARIRSSANRLKEELDRELKVAELRQDIHNQSILRQLGEAGKDIEDNLADVRASLKDLEFDLTGRRDAAAGDSRPAPATPGDENGQLSGGDTTSPPADAECGPHKPT